MGRKTDKDRKWKEFSKPKIQTMIMIINTTYNPTIM